MDIISRSDLSNDTPVILFLFGGGFTHGERNRAVYNFYFNRMAEEGFIIASIDYRLGLKAPSGCIGSKHNSFGKGHRHSPGRSV